MLQEDVNRPDKEESGWYTKWTNRALRRIQQDRNWNFMRTTAQVTVTSGNSSVSLPANFKELASERPAVFVQQEGSSNPWVPVKVTSRSYADSHNTDLYWPASWSASSPSYFEVFIEQAADGTWTLNLVADVNEDVVFRIQYFAFADDLSADGDSNYLTNNYEEMVEAKVKEIAFTSINDPIATDFMAIYRSHRAEAWRDDQARKHGGRRLRMGG